MVVDFINDLPNLHRPCNLPIEPTSSRLPGLLGAIFRLIEQHRNEIRPQPTPLAAKIATRSAAPPRNSWLCLHQCAPLPVLQIEFDKRRVWGQVAPSEARAAAPRRSPDRHNGPIAMRPSASAAAPCPTPSRRS